MYSAEFTEYIAFFYGIILSMRSSMASSALTTIRFPFFASWFVIRLSIIIQPIPAAVMAPPMSMPVVNFFIFHRLLLLILSMSREKVFYPRGFCCISRENAV